jgi:peptidoglycan hydrolase-like protein with peptidoglycan-binding domain
LRLKTTTGVAAFALAAGFVLAAQSKSAPTQAKATGTAKAPATVGKSTTAKSAPVKSTSAKTTGAKSVATKSVATTKAGGKAVARPTAVPVRRYVPQQPSLDRYREIQQALADRGYFRGSVDGMWGPESVDALKRFQQEQKIDDDGKISSLSLIALGLGPRRNVAGRTTDAAGAESSVGSGAAGSPGP